MKKLIILSVVFILCFSLFSFSADWIFKVPVKLKNICPDLKGIRVYCHVFAGPNYGASNQIGGGWESVNPYSNADFNGIVTVDANNHQGKDPMLGTHYKCFLSGDWRGDMSKGTKLSDVKNIKPSCVNKPGTPFVVDYVGTLQ
jgi:hypothetical protein